MKKAQDYVTIFSICFATFLGGVARFYPVFLSNFPLNDGGLFYSMARDVLEHNFSLPAFTSYNGNVIPFGYPPLVFYVMAIIQRFLHIGFTDQIRFLPALISTLSIPTLYLLSKSMTDSKAKSVFAAFAYALMPQSYQWLIMGGGITRSFGVLFAILSILSIWEMFRQHRFRYILSSIILCSLLILTHPAIAWFVFVTAFLIGLRYGLNKTGIIYASATVAGILVITSPWWVTIISRHTLGTFLSAGQTGGFINLSIITLFIAGGPFANIFIVVALFGLIAEIMHRRFFLLAWLILISILPIWVGQALDAIPGALLFGSGVYWVIVPGLLSNKVGSNEYDGSIVGILQYRSVKITFSIIIGVSLFTAMAAPLLTMTNLKPYSQYDQEAMNWVTQNTPVNSQFALMTGEKDWFWDPVSEWFPALTRRISVATVQGSEWLPDQTFRRQENIYDRLQSCADHDYACILDWAKSNTISFSYLYVTKKNGGDRGAAAATVQLMAEDIQLQLVFENAGVSIFTVVDKP